MTDISILLPTRGRTTALKKSIESLINTVDDERRVEILVAFDDDDADSQQYFLDTIVPELDKTEVTFGAYSYPPIGYIRLNEYVNALARDSRSPWLMFFNDDARMITKGWDSVVLQRKDQFVVQRTDTNHEHPYAIFPILPREWYEFFGYVSPHQLSDAWISQVGFMLDIVTTVPIYIEHDRFDITGKNKDETFANRPQLEGNPSHPSDFNHATWRAIRLRDCAKLATHLEQTRGRPMNFWKEVAAGRQDPWEKMIALDTKNRLTVYQPKKNTS